jgi:murein DD-endopeptidase MepM/ murein hydrolase activator NlpD
MSEEQVHHIILLPQDDYWGWVGAVRDFVVHYGTPVTPFPQKAIEFHRPLQTITVVNPPNNAYPMQGDIAMWLAENAPDVRAEVLNVDNPDNLRAIVAERIARDDRLGMSAPEAPPEPTPEPAPTPEARPEAGPGAGIALLWPTDYAYVTQEFGGNPDFYSKFNLPGHEGLDIRAPENANIYACADGTVIRAERNPDEHPYGKHVRIRHANNYKTIYGHLNEVLVDVGDAVEAGQLIGLADNTGNSFGDHLHLTLKLEGATSAGLTSFPFDILDPTPFLISLGDTPREVQTPAPRWAYDQCLVGVHGRADGPMEAADWEAFSQANVEALKLLSTASGEDVDHAREINPNVFITVRARFDFPQAQVSPEQFAETVARDLEPHYRRGIRYVELHNEPNTAIEGWGSGWRDGSEFADFFLQSVELLKGDYPEARWGWPGLAPGDGIDGQRFYNWDFVRGARDAIDASAWIGVHCNWLGANDSNILKPGTGLEYQAYRDQWPNKLIFITAFSNLSLDVDKATKARQYVKYFQHLRDQPGVGAAFSYVVSGSRHVAHQAWRREDGSLTAIPGAIGSRPGI